MSRPPPPAAPTHLLRSHSDPISALWISEDNERIYSGDSSGKVVATSTRSLRAITLWNPHSDSILGVEEFGPHIITHGRDNKLHVWNFIKEPPASARLGGSAALPDLPIPTLAYSMDCQRIELLLGTTDGNEFSAIIALPNLVDSSTPLLIASGRPDIWSLPKCDRLHAAVGQETNKPIFATNPDSGRGSEGMESPSYFPTPILINPSRAGIIMSLHIYIFPPKTKSPTLPAVPTTSLRLLCAYESGSVVLRRYTRAERPISIEGQGWEGPLENQVACRDKFLGQTRLLLTVSADHPAFEIRASLTLSRRLLCIEPNIQGNSSIAIRDDGKEIVNNQTTLRIRLYSTKSFKPLGTLRYHKTNCQTLAFAHSTVKQKDDGKGEPLKAEEGDEDDDEMSASDKEAISRWLVAGGKDSRLSIWTLMSVRIHAFHTTLTQPDHTPTLLATQLCIHNIPTSDILNEWGSKGVGGGDRVKRDLDKQENTTARF
ncbi:WD-40 repeat-containing protein [Ephemerocybe angulata]|uniref:ASTRA-associated protein 1 n=1 Tax=Ephemerocybe angulata TaxID=980116 RepID=A0A8H6I3E8_9AGAR|nr:WD-40 repeat-containing protein [Tulosesus angulatus]